MFQLMTMKNGGCHGSADVVQTTVSSEGHIAFGRMGKDCWSEWIEYASIVGIVEGWRNNRDLVELSRRMAQLRRVHWRLKRWIRNSRIPDVSCISCCVRETKDSIDAVRMRLNLKKSCVSTNNETVLLPFHCLLAQSHRRCNRSYPCLK